MYAVLTGDIINSQSGNATQWTSALKKVLSTIGEYPFDWEIFRGDSFQLVTQPVAALRQALIIKAALKSMTGLDVRIAIGIGTIDQRAQKVTESNGPAFVASGRQFDELKKQTLSVVTPWNDVNRTMEMAIPLALMTIDTWTVKSAEVLLLKWWNPDWSQQQIAAYLQKKGQGNISEALKRGGYEEIQQLLQYFEQQIEAHVATGS
ncbi:transcriptional regulator [Gynurincola endophyticus]|uniref:transcriptional regulator n=1 Tax=Gynurincola endophyticus TaxID=2479004 RepID=UPI000F8E7EB5|nr:transcriptional regulator [Gynurincola endophyticus]